MCIYLCKKHISPQTHKSVTLFPFYRWEHGGPERFLTYLRSCCFTGGLKKPTPRLRCTQDSPHITGMPLGPSPGGALAIQPLLMHFSSVPSQGAHGWTHEHGLPGEAEERNEGQVTTHLSSQYTTLCHQVWVFPWLGVNDRLARKPNILPAARVSLSCAIVESEGKPYCCHIYQRREVNGDARQATGKDIPKWVGQHEFAATLCIY